MLILIIIEKKNGLFQMFDWRFSPTHGTILLAQDKAS